MNQYVGPPWQGIFCAYQQEWAEDFTATKGFARVRVISATKSSNRRDSHKPCVEVTTGVLVFMFIYVCLFASN
jgi:hypothetical protein